MGVRSPIVLRIKDASPSTNVPGEHKTSTARLENELLVTHGASQYLRTLPELFSPKQLLAWDHSIKWYLENYATSEPFAGTRATTAEEYIRNYTLQLAAVLPLEDVLPRDSDDTDLVLEIEEYSVSGSRIGRIHWELLENTSCWAAKSMPQNVTVIRFTIPSRPSNKVLVLGGDEIYQRNTDSSKNILVVTARRGIDDVPHRMIARSIVEVVSSLPSAVKRLVSLKVLRPGTFAALEKELCSHKIGFYDTVHIDMHGSSGVDIGTPYLVFSSSVSTNTDGHNVPALDIARILARYGVNTVILNACESAVENGNAHSNLAKHLARSGIPSVVAMSFKVLDRAATIFTLAFYQQYVTNQQSVCMSVQNARKALRMHSLRKSKYGTMVDILDFFVPKLYQTDGTSDYISGQIEPIMPFAAEERHVNTRKLELVGREQVILKIEDTLTGLSPVIRIQAPPGTGKSFLASHLCTWWKQTHLVEHTATVDPGERTDLNFETLLTTVYQQLSKDEGSVETDVMISYIRSKQCLIVIDSLERYEQADKGFPLSFAVFLKKVCRNWKNYVLILTRHERQKEDWLTKCAPFSISLNNFDLKTSLLLASQCLENQPANSGRAAFEFSRCLEFLVCLGQGNPLAIILLTRRLCSQACDIKDYCAGLIASHDFGIAAEDPFLQNNVDFRCISELRGLIDQDPIRKAAIFQNLERDGHWVMRIDYLRSFWRYIAEDDLRTFLRFLVEAHKRLSRLSVVDSLQPEAVTNAASGFNNILEKELVYEGKSTTNWIGEQVASLATDQHLKSFYVVLKPFIAAGFCNTAAEYDLDPDTTKAKKRYIGIHPLLTLMLRESQNSLHGLSPFAGLKSQVALTRCFASRIARYPIREMYWKPQWTIPKLEMEMEYLNIFSAAAGSLLLSLGPSETMNINLRTCVHSIIVPRYALSRDTRRETVLVYLQEMWVSKFSGHVQEMISAQNRFIFICAALTARLLAVFLGVDRATSITCSWSEVFSRTYCVDILQLQCMVLMLTIYMYYLEYGFEEAEYWKARAETLYRTRSFAGSMGPRKRRFMRFFVNPILGRNGRPEEGGQTERAAFLRWYQSDTGTDTSQPRTGDPELDMYNVHLGAPLSDQWAPTLQTKIFARREFQRGNFSAAREIVEESLEREVRHFNRASVCAPLYVSLAEIAEAEGEINLAIDHLERAISLEEGTSRKHVTRQRWLRALKDKREAR